MGAQAMVAAIKVEVMSPSDDQPTAGALLVSCDLPPICSAAVRPGRPPDMAHTISHHLTSLLTSAACVDLTHLCIVPGKAAWAIWLHPSAHPSLSTPHPFTHLAHSLPRPCHPSHPSTPPAWQDIVCIDADGALFDAALLAALAALSSRTLLSSPLFFPLLPCPSLLIHPFPTPPGMCCCSCHAFFLPSPRFPTPHSPHASPHSPRITPYPSSLKPHTPSLTATSFPSPLQGRGEGEEAGVEGGRGAERDGDGLVVEQTVEGRRLELQALPLAQTVCLYGGHLLVDPTAEEERLGSGSNNVIIAMDVMAREEGSGAGKGAEEGEKGGGGKGERKGGIGRGVEKGGGGSEEGEELLLVFKAGGSARLTAAGMQDCTAAAAVNLRERRAALLHALAEAEKEEEEEDEEEGEEGEEMES
ncbi:unnamed protein product [Closterium sp. Naga37s-1]|nr:unnamed protein product [Closterium sp. Naga37s-1]